MVNRLLRLLGSYDFFGKAVPGAALLFGGWLFLPHTVLELDTASTGTRLGNLVVLLVLLLTLGLMIGQGVHTLGENTEKAFNWLLTRIRDVRHAVALLGLNVPGGLELTGDRTDREGFAEIVSGWWDGTTEWVGNRFWGAFDSFIGHRNLFAYWFVWNYSSEVRRFHRGFNDRWRAGRRNELMNPFCDAFDDRFGDEYFENGIRRAYPSQIKNVYPIVTSHLSNHGIEDHRQFQAIYSFCRSMWVVLLGLTITATFVIFRPVGDMGVFDDPTRVQNALPEALHVTVPVLFLLSTVLFVDAAGTYKRHFVEYLFASFAALEESTEQRGTDVPDD